MEHFLESSKGELIRAGYALRRLLHKLKRILLEQFNKNIYTRILLTNVIVFIIALVILAVYANFMVKQATYDQVEQDLLRKSKRVNFALTQDKNLTWGIGDQTETQQDLLKFQPIVLMPGLLYLINKVPF